MRACLGVLLAILSAQCGRGDPPVAASSRIPLAPCEAPRVRPSALCGTLLVWENRPAGKGRRIALNLVVVPARKALHRDPVFYLAGGPGSSAIDAAGAVSRQLAEVNATRDLVFVDVRGTGRSGALRCEPIPPEAPLQRYFDDFLDDESVRRCLAAQAADVRFYTEPFAVDDLNDVRAALGYERINLYGTSGGTRVALLYLRRHGATVRSLVLHGVHPPDGRMPLAYSRGLESAIEWMTIPPAEPVRLLIEVESVGGGRGVLPELEFRCLQAGTREATFRAARKPYEVEMVLHRDDRRVTLTVRTSLDGTNVVEALESARIRRLMLRAGEMRALRWTDVDFTTGKLRIECNEWYGHITTTKGNRIRHVPMTGRLHEALRQYRHLRGARVLYREDGRTMSASALIEEIQRAARRANLRNNGSHILRHTFCSHLAMRNVPARSIQELAGHRDLSTTQRYMHLSSAAIDDAIRLLNRPSRPSGFGDILETEGSEKANVNG